MHLGALLRNEIEFFSLLAARQSAKAPSALARSLGFSFRVAEQPAGRPKVGGGRP